MNEWEEMTESQAETLHEGSQLRFALSWCCAPVPHSSQGSRGRKQDQDLDSLDVGPWGDFTKIWGASRTGGFESVFSPGPSAYNTQLVFSTDGAG